LRLIDLVKDTGDGMTPAAILADTDIHGLSADSRKVASGYLFAALPGTREDGRRYIDQAIAKGAVAVLAETGTTLESREPPVQLITDDNPRRRLALMAARFYRRQPDVVAAVTGTNGKTSVASFTRQIWRHGGYEAASLGTLGLFPARPSVRRRSPGHGGVEPRPRPVPARRHPDFGRRLHQSVARPPRLPP
jgi:UDP-N-acetylmuramoyl-L-alanyl-D-glutamate--2,6-diaminopimelate ligase